MEIEYDSNKRLTILEERGLDLADAGDLFDKFHLTRRDEKHGEVEERWISVGQLGDDVVIVVWTPRREVRRIVTMWKANDRERKSFTEQRDRSG